MKTVRRICHTVLHYWAMEKSKSSVLTSMYSFVCTLIMAASPLFENDLLFFRISSFEYDQLFFRNTQSYSSGCLLLAVEYNDMLHLPGAWSSCIYTIYKYPTRVHSCKVRLLFFIIYKTGKTSIYADTLCTLSGRNFPQF